MRPAQARSVRGSGFRVLSCRAEGPVRVPVTGAVRRIARHGRRAAPSARARRSPADEPGHAARPLARHRVFVTSRAARRGAARASTTILETHAYASPTQRNPSALRCRGSFVAFLWDGSESTLPLTEFSSSSGSIFACPHEIIASKEKETRNVTVKRGFAIRLSQWGIDRNLFFAWKFTRRNPIRELVGVHVRRF